MVVELLYGVGLILLMIAMIWVAKPAENRDSVPWLRIYIIGQGARERCLIKLVRGSTA